MQISYMYTPVEGIFCVGCVVVQAIETNRIGLVLRPKKLWLFLVRPHVNVEVALIECFMFSSYMVWLHLFQHWFGCAPLMLAPPDPRVSVPEGWK